MNKQLIAMVSILALLVFVGCTTKTQAPAQQAPSAPAEQQPAPVPTPEPVVQSDQKTEEKTEDSAKSSGRTDIGGDVTEVQKPQSSNVITKSVASGEGSGYVNAIECMLSNGDGTLEWELKNTGESDYTLNPTSALSGGNALKMTLNGRTIREAAKTCGSEDSMLKSGASLNCKVDVSNDKSTGKYFVRTAQDSSITDASHNVLNVNTIKGKQSVQFECSEAAATE
ncbi:MAG: hypothetical protein AABX52_04795 [Nanoarchaeota archaeon]